jgi:hypothetical protein
MNYFAHLLSLFNFPFLQFLYTLKIVDAEKAEKLTQSLPPGLTRTDI